MVTMPRCYKYATKQQKRDIKQAIIDGSTESDCKTLIKLSKRFIPLSTFEDFDIQSKDYEKSELKELLDYFKFECRKICYSRHLNPIAIRCIMGRLGLINGEIETYAEMEAQTEVDAANLRKFWSRYGENVRLELIKVYYA